MASQKRFGLKLQGLCVGAVLFPAAFATAQQEYLIVDLGQIAGAVIPPMLQEVHLNNITQPGLDPAFLLPAVQVINVADAQGILAPVRLVDGQTTPIGTLGGAETEVHDVNFFPINPCGTTRLVGASQAVDSFFRAFSWSEDGGMIDLGTLGGDESSAMALNDVRQVVGWAQDASGEAHATLWDGLVGPMDLNTLVGKLGPSLANDIDNYGHIVGQSEYTGKAQATAWVRNIAGAIIPIELGALGGDLSEALAIDVGQTSGGVLPTQMVVAGWSEVTPGGVRHAALWNVDSFLQVVMPTDLGTLGGTNSIAYDVDNLNIWPAAPCCIVGASDIAPPLSAKRLRRSQRKSSAGVVTEHAFIWDPNKGMRDLNDLIDPNLGWELIRADSVNSSLMITGIGELNGVLHAFRLDPINPPQACPTDANNDGNVNVTDLLQLLAAWGTCP